MRSKTIAIAINVKDRPTELALLLQSLRTQTETNFDIFILDDGSSTLLTNYSFFAAIISRMRHDGHRIQLIRNNISKGVSLSRQQLIDTILTEGTHLYIVPNLKLIFESSEVRVQKNQRLRSV